jgi:hypothetical protein
MHIDRVASTYSAQTRGSSRDAFTASGADEREQRLRPQEQPPAVDRVRDRAADDGERQQGDELAEREQADLESRVRQLVQLEGRRDRRDLASERRDRLADEEPPEGAVPP